MSNEIEKVGYIEKGTGKHQSNIIYSAGGIHLQFVQQNT